MILAATPRCWLGRRRRRRLLRRLFGGGGLGQQFFDLGFVGLRHRLGRELVEERTAAQVGAHERRLTAEPRRNQFVRIRLAQEDQGAAEALDVRLVPWLARDEVFGDEARLGGMPPLDVSVGQLRLRAEHRRLESAVHADLDQPHQRRDVIGDAGDELLQHGGGAGPVDLRDSRVGGELHDEEAGLRRLLGDAPAQQRDLLAARRVTLEEAAHDGEAFFELLAAKLHVRDREQQFRVVAGGFRRQVERRGREVALRDERTRQLRRQFGVARIDDGRLPQRLQRFVRPACHLERGGQHPKLLHGPRTFPGLSEVARGEVDVQQLLPDLVVVRVQLGRFTQGFDRLGLPAFLGQFAGDLFQVAEGAGLVAHLDPGARRRQAAFVILGVE